MSKAKLARPRRASTILDADYDRIRFKTRHLRARRVVEISAETHEAIRVASERTSVPMTKIVDLAMGVPVCRP